MKPSVLSATPEGLKRRIFDLERQVADLHRRGDWNYDIELDASTASLGNHGTAAVSAGAASAVVSHGSSVQPAAGEILIAPANQAAGETAWWISDIGTAAFTINVAVAPAAEALFHWAYIPGSEFTPAPSAVYTTDGLPNTLTTLGMSHYWPFNEGEPATAYDLLGGVDLAINGSPDLTKRNPFDDGFTMDPLGNSANYAINGSMPSFTGDFTIGLWFRPASTLTHCLLGRSADNDHYLERHSADFRAQSITGSTIRTWSSAPAISVGTWESIILVRSSGSGQLYHNGTKLTGGGSLTGTYGFNNVGRYNLSGTNPTNGPMSHLFMGGTAMSDADVSNLYAEMSAELA